jgi:hypothetical protein
MSEITSPNGAAPWKWPIFCAACALLRSVAITLTDMQDSHQTVHAGFDRFQELLLAMRVGDELRASDAARLTGLSHDVCRSVLEGLKRAGLMTHQGEDRFVRKTLEVATT